MIAGKAPVLVHNCGEVEYGSTDLSVEVLKERLRTDNQLNNGAAARFIDADGNEKIAVAFSGGGKGRTFHAEQKLLSRLGKDNILEIYSELQPCSGKGPSCSTKLQGVRQTWSWKWSTSDKGGEARKLQGKAISKMFKDAAAGIW